MPAGGKGVNAEQSCEWLVWDTIKLSTAALEESMQRQTMRHGGTFLGEIFGDQILNCVLPVHLIILVVSLHQFFT